ncbi:MAG: hypothetical protein AAFN50_13430 [Pseudomonadota bacterium]
MNKLTQILTVASLLAAAPAAMACDYPAKPDDMPDGSTATKEQMLEGVKMINAYQEAMNTYLSCIEADEVVAAQAVDDDDEDAKARRQELFNQKYNAAVDEQTMVVEEFNAQIRAYKSRSN